MCRPRIFYVVLCRLRLAFPPSLRRPYARAPRPRAPEGTREVRYPSSAISLRQTAIRKPAYGAPERRRRTSLVLLAGKGVWFAGTVVYGMDRSVSSNSRRWASLRYPGVCSRFVQSLQRNASRTVAVGMVRMPQEEEPAQCGPLGRLLHVPAQRSLR